MCRMRAPARQTKKEDYISTVLYNIPPDQRHLDSLDNIDAVPTSCCRVVSPMGRVWTGTCPSSLTPSDFKINCCQGPARLFMSE
ncbi:hypothetical protein BV898_07256 [Hypsibius exemplaris]|uniref:Uncharacterized protein n=1 Tax=Hypsibius exemplaris TaxID=2072580 RepID=A0A1W0WU02_HYPEX|nr:hypothetical protein BV898_07256 [Hypsibius exemplaris]